MYTTDGPQLTIVSLKIFWVCDGVKGMHIQQKPYFGFWILIFSQLAICSKILSCDAGPSLPASFLIVLDTLAQL